MRSGLLLLTIFISISSYSQNWYGGKTLQDEIKSSSAAKDSAWYEYTTDWNFNMKTTAERGVYYNVNDFGFEYPVNLHGLAAYFFGDGYSFGFKVYAKNGSTVLYEKQGFSSVTFRNEHFLDEPIILTDDFWIAVDPDINGFPWQPHSAAVEKSHSFTGGAGNWNTLLEDGEIVDFLTQALLSPHTGTDLFAPVIRSITEREFFMGQDGYVCISLQDQNSVISPVIGQYSFDGGVSWTDFELIGTKGTFEFSGFIPGKPDGTAGLLRFLCEDTLGNAGLSEEYSIVWSRVFPMLKEDFEDNHFPPDRWSLSTIGAGWVQNSFLSETVYSGSYSASHLDDVGTQDDWLITPEVTLPAAGTVLLTFFQTSRWTEFLDSHEVCLTTDNGSTWTQLYVDDQPFPDSDVSEAYSQEIISLSNYSGQSIRIGWHYTGDYSDQWFIDDVKIIYDGQAPEIIQIAAENSILPVLGTYVNNDMELKLTLFDVSGVGSVTGYYSFDAGLDPVRLEFAQDDDDSVVWKGVIPARNDADRGTIYFNMIDRINNSAVSGTYNIQFLPDSSGPVLTDVFGLTSLVGEEAEIVINFSDFSQIVSCKGYYSKDDFDTTYEFDLSASKTNYYRFSGTIPPETVVVENGKIYFIVTDLFGNATTSPQFLINWLDSVPQFDLRTSLSNNYVTSVKMQNGGTCWTHGALASIESNLAMTRTWEKEGEEGEPNLAEYHLDWWNGFNQHNNDDMDPPDGYGLEVHYGGDYLVTSAYLSRGEGAVRESDGQSFDVAPLRRSGSYHYYYPRDVEWYSIDSTLSNIDLIKKKVMEHGAVGTCMMYDDSFMSASFTHYQPSSDTQDPNHAVAIVGWDDNKTTQAPEGTGAWLIKNSWGTDWGEAGYFWISYYDKHCAKNAEMGAISYYNVEPLKYNKIYYHDYHGWRDTKKETVEAFNAFTTIQDAIISAVSFYTAEDNVDYTAAVYDDFDGEELTNLLSEKTGNIQFRGFHTIDLTSGVALTTSDDFYIYVSLSKGGHAFDRTSEIPVLLGSKSKILVESKASAGESFYKKGTEWLDLFNNTEIENPGTANFCIKALCNSTTGIEQNNNTIKGSCLYQNYPNPFNPLTTIRFDIADNNTNVRLAVFNIKGELVGTAFEGMKDHGTYSASFNASSLTSGVYYYALETDGTVRSMKKMVLLK